MGTNLCISDSDNSYLSNGELAGQPTEVSEVAPLRRLADNLETLFQSPDNDFFADGRIIVDGSHEIPVHRCILCARSPFFRSVFAAEGTTTAIDLREWTRDYEVGYDSVVTVLSYIYTGRVRPPPEGVCACADEDCNHLACRPVIGFLLEILYTAFIFQIAELVSLYQRHLLEIVDKVAIEDSPIILFVANLCNKACGRLLSRYTETVITSDLDDVTIEKALPLEISKQILLSRRNNGGCWPNFADKHIRRIHNALDSDDVELVRLLLREEHTTLDKAYALHYAVGLCDSKTTRDLLDLGLADVNLRSRRGDTVLHVAAMKKDPRIIVSLLTKGARLSDVNAHGYNALQICKRRTKLADYWQPTEGGKATPNDRLCIEILEQAERRDPQLGEASLSLAAAGDDLRSRLLYLESRVGLARLLFPTQAKVAMELAQVHRTSEFPLTGATGAHNRTLDLNDAPFKIKEEHLARMRALSRTVEVAKRYFPRCAAFIDQIMDNDDLANLAAEDSEEHLRKRKRFKEIQNVLSKAFLEDQEEALLSPAPSPCVDAMLMGKR